MKPARIVLANLHATSRPVLVVPWLLVQCRARRVDAVLLQECTPGHARLLRLAPAWTLIRDAGAAGEAILARRRRVTEAHVFPDMSPGWMGKHTGEPHAGRVLPTALIRGWLRVASIHLPPGWLAGALDRQHAGRVYVRRLRSVTRPHRAAREPRFYGGDWQYKPDELDASRSVPGRSSVGPESIDHAEAYRCVVRRFKRIGRGPGMDHDAWLYIVEALR